MNNKAHLRPKDYDSNGDIIPMACKEEKGDLISRKWLTDAIRNRRTYLSYEDAIKLIEHLKEEIVDLSDNEIQALDIAIKVLEKGGAE